MLHSIHTWHVGHKVHIKSSAFLHIHTQPAKKRPIRILTKWLKAKTLWNRYSPVVHQCFASLAIFHFVYFSLSLLLFHIVVCEMSHFLTISMLHDLPIQLAFFSWWVVTTAAAVVVAVILVPGSIKDFSHSFFFWNSPANFRFQPFFVVVAVVVVCYSTSQSVSISLQCIWMYIFGHLI